MPRHGSVRRFARRSARKGAATLEFAVVAPLVFFLIFALIQFSGLMMNKNLITAAACDGARLASLSDTDSSEDVVALVKARLQRSGMDPARIDVEIEPGQLAAIKSGEEVTVRVITPVSEMTWFWVLTPPNFSVTREITYQRE